MKYRKILLPVLLAGFLFASCGEGKPVSRTGFQLDTVVTVTVYEPEQEPLLHDCMKLCEEYERKFSRTLPESEISRLNSGELADEAGYAALSEETVELLSEGRHYSELSDGAFDLTIGAVTPLWNFTSEPHEVPDAAAVEAAVSRVGWEKTEISGQKFLLPSGMAIDCGAIAKGYIADRIKDYLKAEGVERALINLGGNVLCIGSRSAQRPFRVGVRRPFGGADDSVLTLEITDQSVVTSGIYERCFTKNGEFYHHILDPSTGFPTQSDLSAVTVISDTSVQGDALSTACMVLGLEKGMALIDSLPDVDAIFIERDGTLHFSADFSVKYELVPEKNSSEAGL